MAVGLDWMGALGMTSELERFSSLVGLIYDAALDPSLWPAVLEETCSLAKGAAAALGSVDLIDSKGNIDITWGYDPHYLKLYRERYFDLHPLKTEMPRLRVGEVVSIMEAMKFEDLIETRLYREWAKPQGLIDALHLNLDKSATGVAALGMARHEREGFVDDETRHTLKLLFPHLRRSVLIGRVIDLRKVEAATFADTLDGLSAGMILVDASGRIVHANAAGETMMEARTPIRRSGGALAFATPEAERAWRDVLNGIEAEGAALGSKGVALPIVPPDGTPHVAHVLPLGSGARRRAGISYSAAAAVFVRSTAIERGTALDAIAKLYGLTPTEGRVLQAVVEVGGAPSIARAFGIADATVRSHLKQIYQKTGLNRQADLVSLVAGVTSPL